MIKIDIDSKQFQEILQSKDFYPYRTDSTDYKANQTIQFCNNSSFAMGKITKIVEGYIFCQIHAIML